MTVHEAIRKASTQIARRDAETLLLHTVRRERAWLLAHPEASLSPPDLAGFFRRVSQRAGHWPLQYLTGHQEFFGLDLGVSGDTLIPRPETERLVEAVLAWAAQAGQTADRTTGLEMVDVGTGSGAIALALAWHLPEANIVALDISRPVQTVLERNAFQLGVSDRVRFRESDLLSVLHEDIKAGRRFDAVVSNPPYIPLAEARSLQPEVRDFEPHLALFAGEDGLAIYRRLIPEAWAALRPGGLLALEFGFGQKAAIAGLLSEWVAVRFLEDYAGIPRVALAERGAAA